jgi:hypothetical protein
LEAINFLSNLSAQEGVNSKEICHLIASADHIDFLFKLFQKDDKYLTLSLLCLTGNLVIED